MHPRAAAAASPPQIGTPRTFVMSVCGDSIASGAHQADLDVKVAVASFWTRTGTTPPGALSSHSGSTVRPSAESDTATVAMVDVDADMPDPSDMPHQEELPPADRRNEMAADMIPRQGEEQAIRDEALAMTRDALRVVTANMMAPRPTRHSVQELRHLANRQISPVRTVKSGATGSNQDTRSG